MGKGDFCKHYPYWSIFNLIKAKALSNVKLSRGIQLVKVNTIKLA